MRTFVVVALMIGALSALPQLGQVNGAAEPYRVERKFIHPSEFKGRPAV